MPTTFSHAVFATAVGKAYAAEPLPAGFWILTAGCAMLPDVDAIAFAFGIRYDSLLEHRGLTHSIAFAVLIGFIVGVSVFRTSETKVGRLELIFYFTLITLSHPLLDALTNGGRGVALFAPFSNERYFFPLRPIEVSPIGMRFFSERGLEVITSEVVWVWLPALLVYAITRSYRKLRTT
jgi:inner membrane protein